MINSTKSLIWGRPILNSFSLHSQNLSFPDGAEVNTYTLVNEGKFVSANRLVVSHR